MDTPTAQTYIDSPGTYFLKLVFVDPRTNTAHCCLKPILRGMMMLHKVLLFLIVVLVRRCTPSAVKYAEAYCSSFQASRTSSATEGYCTCSFLVCPTDYLSVDGCGGCRADSGMQYLRLYRNDSLVSSATGAVSSCAPCASIDNYRLVSSSSCQIYELRIGCIGNSSCGGSIRIRTSNVTLVDSSDISQRSTALSIQLSETFSNRKSKSRSVDGFCVGNSASTTSSFPILYMILIIVAGVVFVVCCAIVVRARLFRSVKPESDKGFTEENSHVPIPLAIMIDGSHPQTPPRPRVAQVVAPYRPQVHPELGSPVIAIPASPMYP